jgi:hypothetical protein
MSGEADFTVKRSGESGQDRISQCQSSRALGAVFPIRIAKVNLLVAKKTGSTVGRSHIRT